MKAWIVSAVLVMAGAQAMAGNGDGAVVFHCESLPTVDSALSVMGIADELTGDIDLVVLVAGQVKAQDKGLLVEGAARYEGQIFEMEFSQVTHIVAKMPNDVLSVGQADSLICAYPALP
ncbi:hypothetical protein EZJ49_00865 [Bdellovibrio bacteriovorus]|uniref:hypothetical protein n=1 Tax=Bdellovibrio bacteriovorus TaxID=959 RepID=UPI0021CF7824|nr:hypothetical protein [Bdellovibrio bacteriovorus]UXR64805.1 hypothetical protein EZJ49_00865 [Bdellovibrio bacteriovorus]